MEWKKLNKYDLRTFVKEVIETIFCFLLIQLVIYRGFSHLIPVLVALGLITVFLHLECGKYFESTNG